MEVKIIKIKCPHCGALLAVKQQPGIEGKRVKCPVCKESSPFTAYKNVVASPYQHIVSSEQNEERTLYEVPYNPVTHSGSLSTGILTCTNISGLSFHLNPGKNIVGRKASVSTADFQIPTPSSRLSREHLVIDVKSVTGKGYVHYLSLYKERCNETYINGERLVYGDCVVLKNGDVVKMPDVELKFEIANDESTTY